MADGIRKEMAAYMREQGDELAASFYDESPDMPLVEWAKAAVAGGANPFSVLSLVQAVKDALLITFWEEGNYDGE